jgi:hypothetical protein
MRSNLLIWSFNESGKDSFVSQRLDPGKDFDTACNTVVADDEILASFQPKLVEDRGYSSLPLKIMNARQLETAIKSQQKELTRLFLGEEYRRLFVFVGPFWYKLSMALALHRLNLWDRTMFFEGVMTSVFLKVILREDGKRMKALPNGVNYHPDLSRLRGQKKSLPQKHPWYQRLPLKYQYLSFVPIYNIPEEEAAPLKPIVGAEGIDFDSFQEDIDPDSIVI